VWSLWGGGAGVVWRGGGGGWGGGGGGGGGVGGGGGGAVLSVWACLTISCDGFKLRSVPKAKARQLTSPPGCEN